VRGGVIISDRMLNKSVKKSLHRMRIFGRAPTITADYAPIDPDLAKMPNEPGGSVHRRVGSVLDVVLHVETLLLR
jgi:hypothetical protein